MEKGGGGRGGQGEWWWWWLLEVRARRVVVGAEGLESGGWEWCRTMAVSRMMSVMRCEALILPHVQVGLKSAMSVDEAEPQLLSFVIRSSGHWICVSTQAGGTGGGTE